MKRLIIIILMLSPITHVFGQKYLTQSGTIKFFSHSPLEDIEAYNNQVSGVINMDNGEMAFTLLMKAFTFEKALMQEHFNEKYVESDKFPKASFKGKIVDFDKVKLADTPTKVTTTGTLTIHGVSREITTEGTLAKGKGNTIKGSSEFTIELDNYDIEIPSTVKDNISNTIKITVNMEYEKLD